MNPSAFREDAWLAGFIDGEGCFTRKTARRPYGRGVYYYPVFKIGLRWDDKPILDDLKAEFGGSVHDSRSARSGNRQQGFCWTLYGRWLPGLVEYLDRYPLRAKKAEQYAEWKATYGL